MNSRQQPVLLVDVGGVLLLHNHELLAPITARFGGVSTAEDFQRAHYGCHNESRGAGGSEIDYFDLFPKYAGIPTERQDDFRREYRAFHRIRNMCHWPDPAARTTLAEIVADGIPVAVVSQADGTIAQMLLDAQMCQEGPGPGVSVDTIVDSAVVGFNKPDPKLYQYALDQIGATPEQAVHVGDTVLGDVRGAQAAGILPLHYDPYGDCNDRPGDHEHIRVLAEVRPYLDRIATFSDRRDK